MTPRRRLRAGRCAVAAAWLALACSAEAPEGVEGGQWRSYAGDPGSNRYSPLDQIDAGNVRKLAVAWRWVSADVAWKRGLERAARDGATPHPAPEKVRLIDFQGTPIMVDGVLYGATSIGQLYALDAGTGELRWLHDPGAYRSARPNSIDFIIPKHRGVTYWRDGDDERIFVPTHDAYLLAVDAKTGEPVASFGEGGRVDLLKGLRREGIRRLADYFQTSPAALHRDTLIVGGTVGDRPETRPGIPGDVRGYDARTGALRWTFHVVPEADEVGAETWEDGSLSDGGAANVWGPISVDTELGAVYLTTSTPTNDFYGGHRPGDNLFGESVVCLDAETGERRWHFQLIHHGLWDYDPGAPANVVDLDVDGRRIPALAQVTKQGFVFVFDRRTGEPVWPIEERPVPASDVPGERASPTQPFPTRPPPFERQGMTEDDLIDFTPELRAQALEVFRKYRSGPLFTPPSERGTIMLPGSDGGSNWRGASFDPETHTLYVPSITAPLVVKVKPGDGGEHGFRYVFGGALPLDALRRPVRIPIVKPPWSRITAIDLDRGEIVWQVPNGDGPRKHRRLAPLGLPPLGSGVGTCSLVTRTLLFAADGSAILGLRGGEPIFRAYDKATGEMLHALRLPARAKGCPMTYLHEGVQYVVVPVAEGRVPPQLVALALPRGT